MALPSFSLEIFSHDQTQLATLHVTDPSEQLTFTNIIGALQVSVPNPAIWWFLVDSYNKLCFSSVVLKSMSKECFFHNDDSQLGVHYSWYHKRTPTRLAEILIPFTFVMFTICNGTINESLDSTAVPECCIDYMNPILSANGNCWTYCGLYAYDSILLQYYLPDTPIHAFKYVDDEGDFITGQ